MNDETVEKTNETKNDVKMTRRDIIKTGAALGAMATFGALKTNYAWAQGNGRIKVGLVGCGGRGKGAAGDSAKASKDVQIVALGDVFDWRIKEARNNLKGLGDQFAVPEDKSFVGFDAYKQVVDNSGVDLVIFATPPGFRPLHVAYAVDKGKHVFMEKPVAVDPVGARSIIASGEIAKQKKLAIVTGTQRRHEQRYLQTIEHIRAGDIGDVTAGRIYWNQGGLWMNKREDGWSDVEWQLRNWLYFTWLSGDHIVEQHVHNIDVMNWVMNATPVKAYGMGGRQVRTDPAYGHIFDHFAIEYEFANGARWAGQCRQIDGTASRVGEDIIGTKGSAWSGGIRGDKAWRYDGDGRNPYEQEHVDLIASIQKGEPLNEAKRIAESTLTAIMARESAYTGQEISWDQIMNSSLSLAPVPLDQLKMDMKLAIPDVPMPGKTKLDRKEFGV